MSKSIWSDQNHFRPTNLFWSHRRTKHKTDIYELYLKMDCLIRRSPRQVHTILDLDVFVQLHNLLLILQIVQQAFFQNQVFYYDDYYLMMTYWKKNIEYLEFLDIFNQNFVWRNSTYIDYSRAKPGIYCYDRLD